MEQQAGEYLAGLLSVSNYVEFHREVGGLLREYQNDGLAPIEALWQIQRLYDELKNANDGLKGRNRGTT